MGVGNDAVLAFIIPHPAGNAELIENALTRAFSENHACGALGAARGILKRSATVSYPDSAAHSNLKRNSKLPNDLFIKGPATSTGRSICGWRWSCHHKFDKQWPSVQDVFISNSVMAMLPASAAET